MLISRKQQTLQCICEDECAVSCGLALRAEALAHVLLNQREASEGQVPAHHHHSHVYSAVQCSAVREGGIYVYQCQCQAKGLRAFCGLEGRGRRLVCWEYLIETVADTAQLGRKLAGGVDDG